MKQENKSILFYTILFLSGVSALIYQIVWIKEFGLVFGVIVFSTSTVLAAFMSGLALGSYIFGRLADKRINPLKLIIILEIGIGLFAIFFPFLFNKLSIFYSYFANNANVSSYQLQLFRFFMSFLFLLLPTILMGGVIPVMSKYIIRSIGKLGSSLSKLYAFNNLGAFLGVLLAGFILVQTFGLNLTLYIAAGINFFNAILLLSVYIMNKQAFSRNIKNEIQKIKSEPIAYDNISNLPPKLLKLALWVFAIEGFTTLAYEVIWTRIMISFTFDQSTYLYSTIIFSFIFGLFLGGLILSRFIDRIKQPLLWLGWLEVIIGITALIFIIVFLKSFPLLANLRANADSWWKLVFREYIIVFLILSIPTILMGMTFPLVGKIYTENTRVLGKRIGIIGFLDTVGSIAGSLIAGFLFIPFFGLKTAFIITVIINVIIGLRVIIAYPSGNKKKHNILSIITVTITILLIIAMPSQTGFMALINQDKGQRLAFYKEGVEATVAVHQFPNGFYGMSVNGKKTAFTNKEDIRVHNMLAYLPYFAKPNSETAFVIGLGMGVTTKCLAALHLKQVDVAEISPGVIEASQKVFHSLNQKVTADSNVNIIIEDGRGYLFSTQKKYDIITTNAVHPRLSPNIYTKEFYQICKQKLSDKGVICQWLPTNLMTETEFKSLIKSFISVFPNTSLWYINHGHTLLLGVPVDLNIDINTLKKYFKKKSVKRNMQLAYIQAPARFISMYAMGAEELNEYIRDVKANTDQHPTVEFSRVIDINPRVQVLEFIHQHKPNYEEIVKSDSLMNKETKFYKYLQYSREELEMEMEIVIQKLSYQNPKKQPLRGCQ